MASSLIGILKVNNEIVRDENIKFNQIVRKVILLTQISGVYCHSFLACSETLEIGSMLSLFSKLINLVFTILFVILDHMPLKYQ